MAAAAVLEQGDVAIRPWTRQAVAAQVEQVAFDPVGAEPPFLHRHEQISADPDRRLPGVDEDPGALERLGVRLAHIGLVPADQIQVLAGLQPLAEHQRGLGRGRRADDVGATARGLDVGGRFERHAFDRRRGGQRLGLLAGAVPDHYALDRRPHRAVRADEMRGLRARADHAKRLDVLAGEKVRAEGGVRGGLPVRELGAVEARERPAVPAVEKHVDGLNGGRPRAGGIGREHGGELDADPAALLPRGADEQGVGTIRRRLGHEQVVLRIDGVEVALPQPFHEVGIARDRPHPRGVDDVHVGTALRRDRWAGHRSRSTGTISCAFG